MNRPAWSNPRRIAHRGGGSLAPENTLAALRAAVSQRYRAVEFDVMLTADEAPVLMHDPDFGRTIAGPGRVATTKLADLMTRDAGSWFDARFADEPVPTFEDAVRFCRAQGLWMNVEIKPSPGTEVRTGAVVGQITAQHFTDVRDAAALPLFSSFSLDALTAARSAAPHIPRALLVETLEEQHLDQARALDCVSINGDERHLDEATIARVHEAGFAVLAYTVNDAARLAMLEGWGIDAVFTDRIDVIAPA